MKYWLLHDLQNNDFYYKSFNKQIGNSIDYNFYYKEIFNFEFSETNCIYEMFDVRVESNDIVVDLGANVGFFTYYAAQKCKQVISVEGSPELFSCLVHNTSNFRNIKYLNAHILANQEDPCRIWSRNPSMIKLKIENIFNIFNIDKINFLKIDIEGGEYEIFKDIDKKILDRIDKIAIETHADEKNDILIKSIDKHLHYFDWFHPQKQSMFYFKK